MNYHAIIIYRPRSPVVRAGHRYRPCDTPCAFLTRFQVMDILRPNCARSILSSYRIFYPGDIRPYSLGNFLGRCRLMHIVNEDSIVNHNATKFPRRGVVEPASGAVEADRVVSITTRRSSNGILSRKGDSP